VLELNKMLSLMEATMRRHITAGMLFVVMGLLANLGTAFGRPVIMERTSAFEAEVPTGTAGPYNPGNPGNPAPRF
jgi:hypothetical protein